MELLSDEFAILHLYRKVKIQLGGVLPNIVNLTFMSFTCWNKLVIETQSTELFVQPQLGFPTWKTFKCMLKPKKLQTSKKP